MAAQKRAAKKKAKEVKEPELHLPRWRATVAYRHNDGIKTADYDLEELSDIDAIVEGGPHWDTVAGIQIVLQRPASHHGLTVEDAEKM